MTATAKPRILSALVQLRPHRWQNATAAAVPKNRAPFSTFRISLNVIGMIEFLEATTNPFHELNAVCIEILPRNGRCVNTYVLPTTGLETFQEKTRRPRRRLRGCRPPHATCGVPPDIYVNMLLVRATPRLLPETF